MKLRNPLIYLAVMICTALILITALSTAYATNPGDWYIPWGRYDQWMMNSATLSNCDVTYSMGKKTVVAYSGGTQYTGYWHSMNVSFNYPDGPTYLEIIAPADGTVIYSQSDCLDVETDEGDVYELATSGNSSKMYTLSRGTHISGGKVVGEVYLRESNPTLMIQYLVQCEPTYLFGILRRDFVNGANLINYQCCTYDTRQTSGSSSGGSSAKADLVPDPIQIISMSDSGRVIRSMQGAYVIYPPCDELFLLTGITNVGDVDTRGFNNKWIIDGSTIAYIVSDPRPANKNFQDQGTYTYFTAPTVPGEYTITFVADYDDDVDESIESNNVVTETLWIGY